MNKARALDFLRKKFKIVETKETRKTLTFGVEIIVLTSKKEFEQDPAGQLAMHLDFIEAEFALFVAESRQFIRKAKGYKLEERIPEEPSEGWGSCSRSIWFSKVRGNAQPGSDQENERAEGGEPANPSLPVGKGS